MPALAMALALAFALALAEESCATADTPIALSAFAHTSNEAFIASPRGFSPVAVDTLALGAVDADGRITRLQLEHERFFTYVSDNGWNNQLLNLFAAIDMARRLNRTLVVPPFQWARRRGPAKVSVARLIDLRSVAAVGVRVVADDEFGSVEAALAAAGASVRTLSGEGQPHRKRRMPRWAWRGWVDEHSDEGARVLRVTCCLFWTWSMEEAVATELYSSVRYHPSLIRAAREAAAALGGRYAAMHIRRGDKAKVDRAYSALFGRMMSADYFVALADAQPIARGATVYVATDELDRGWFETLAAARGYALRFVDELEQPPLLDALSTFPQPLWPDVLAILEQIVCIEASGGFVGSLPSTLSGHIVNARLAAARAAPRRAGAGGGEAGGAPTGPFFVKLHESCCDARTAADLLRLPGVNSLADVPCHPHEGNAWC